MYLHLVHLEHTATRNRSIAEMLVGAVDVADYVAHRSALCRVCSMPELCRSMPIYLLHSAVDVRQPLPVLQFQYRCASIAVHCLPSAWPMNACRHFLALLSLASLQRLQLNCFASLQLYFPCIWHILHILYTFCSILNASRQYIHWSTFTFRAYLYTILCTSSLHLLLGPPL